MINILIITHGPLAKALADTSELIVGKNQFIDSIGLFHGESAEDFKHKVERKIDELSNENDLLIFTDLYGGTPSNSVLIKLNTLGFPKSIVCYTGINLPLLIEAIPLSESSSNVQELSKHLDEVMNYTIQNVTKQFNS